MSDQPDFTPPPVSDELKRRMAAVIHSTSNLMQSLMEILSPEMRVTLEHLSHKGARLGVSVLFGDGNTMPLLRMIGANSSGEQYYLIAEVNRDSVRPTDCELH